MYIEMLSSNEKRLELYAKDESFSYTIHTYNENIVIVIVPCKV